MQWMRLSKNTVFLNSNGNHGYEMTSFVQKRTENSDQTRSIVTPSEYISH